MHTYYYTLYFICLNIFLYFFFAKAGVPYPNSISVAYCTIYICSTLGIMRRKQEMSSLPFTLSHIPFPSSYITNCPTSWHNVTDSIRRKNIWFLNIFLVEELRFGFVNYQTQQYYLDIIIFVLILFLKHLYLKKLNFVS